MIKLFLILSVLLSIAYMREKDPFPFITETAYPVVGLFNPERSDFWLAEKKVKAIVEGPYVEIQSIYTYKNLEENLLTAKFEFPQMENDIFHKVELRHQNRSLVFFEEANTPKKEFAKVNPYTSERYSYKEIEAGSLNDNETVEVVFTVIRLLKVQLNQFYELSIQPYHVPRFGTLNSGFFKANYNVQVELKSESPFGILANPTHQVQPELSNSTDSLSGIVIHKALYNFTMSGVFWFSGEFKIYFASSDFNAPQTIMATNPSDSHNHAFMFSLIPNLDYFPNFPWSHHYKKSVRRILRNLSNPDNFSKLKNLTIQSDLYYYKNEYLFVVDQSDSMKGSRLENLKKALSNFLGTLSDSIPKFSILSFGNDSRLHWEKTDEYNGYKVPENVTEIMKWVETLEANMGEKDLFGALKYAFEEYEWSRHPKNVIILTDEEISNAEEVIKLVQENSHSQKICPMGVDGDGNNIQKIREAAGCETELIPWWSQEFGDRALNVLGSTLKSPEFKLAYEITCINDQNQTVHQEEGYSDGISRDSAFIKWVTLQGIPNLSSCEAKIFYYSQHRCFYDQREIEIFASQAAQSPEIWRKVADHAQFQDQLLKTEESKRALMVQKEEEPTVVPNQIECDKTNSFESQEIAQEELICNDKPHAKRSFFDIYQDQFHNLQCTDQKRILTGIALPKPFFSDDEDEDEDGSPSLKQEEPKEESNLLREEEPEEEESFSSLKIICIGSVLTLLFVAGLLIIS